MGACGVEGQVARSGARSQRRLVVQVQRAGARVEGADTHGVGSEVHAQHPGARRVGEHLVGVRGLLTDRVRSASLVPEHGSGGVQRSVGAHGEGGDAAGAVVGGDQVSTGQCEVGGSTAVHRPDPAEQPQVVAGEVEGGGRAGLGLADRVEGGGAGAQGEIRRIGDDVRGGEDGQRPGLPVHGRDGDPPTVRRRERPYVCPSRTVAAHRFCPSPPTDHDSSDRRDPPRR